MRSPSKGPADGEPIFRGKDLGSGVIASVLSVSLANAVDDTVESRCASTFFFFSICNLLLDETAVV